MSNLNWKFFPITEFTHYNDAWQSLSATQHLSALLTPDFVEPLTIYFGKSDSTIAVLYEDTTVRGFTILQQAGFKRWQTFQPSQAPIGIFALHDQVDRQRAFETLVQQLRPSTWLVGVTQLDPLILERPANSSTISTVDYIETARIAVDGSFDDFWKARSRNTRQNLNKQRNRFSREGVTLRMESISNPTDMESVLKDYGQLEAKGWKAAKGTAIELTNAQGKFYLDIMTRFAKANSAIAYRYWYDNQVAAVNLCIHGDGVIYILKTTYDESIKGSSPAMLLHQDIFQNIFEEKSFHTIEFYGRVMDWHRKWTTDIRQMYHLNIYKSPVIKKIVSMTSSIRK